MKRERERMLERGRRGNEEREKGREGERRKGIQGIKVGQEKRRAKDRSNREREEQQKKRERGRKSKEEGEKGKEDEGTSPLPGTTPAAGADACRNLLRRPEPTGESILRRRSRDLSQQQDDLCEASVGSLRVSGELQPGTRNDVLLFAALGEVKQRMHARHRTDTHELEQEWMDRREWSHRSCGGALVHVRCMSCIWHSTSASCSGVLAGCAFHCTCECIVLLVSGCRGAAAALSAREHASCIHAVRNDWLCKESKSRPR